MGEECPPPYCGLPVSFPVSVVFEDSTHMRKVHVQQAGIRGDFRCPSAFCHTCQCGNSYWPV